MAKEETKITLEREYVIPLRRGMDKVADHQRAERAISEIRKFLLRHLKVYDRDEKKIKISKWLNEQIWARNISNPPTKIKVKAVKYASGEVFVESAELTKRAVRGIAKESKIKTDADKIKEERKAADEKQAAMEKAHAEEHAQQEAAKLTGALKESAEQSAQEKMEEEKEKILQKEAPHKEHEIVKQKKETHKRVLTGV